MLKIPLSSSVHTLSTQVLLNQKKGSDLGFLEDFCGWTGPAAMSTSSQSFVVGRPASMASPSQSHRFCGPSATASGGGSFDTLNRVIADLCSRGNPKVMKNIVKYSPFLCFSRNPENPFAFIAYLKESPCSC